MTATRRLAAILAADVAGYSRLMGADEEGTLDRLKAHRRELVDPKIGEHRGRIVKTTGDGMLVEFASVVDAVRCAVEVQRGIVERNIDLSQEERIELRIGINLGDIIADGDDIFGDGVNIAARLEALAEPGGLCISGVVWDQIDGKLTYPFTDRGVRTVKNIARPVRSYALDPVAVAATALMPVPARPALRTRRAPAPRKAVPRLSIVVLPLANLSNDPEQEYFADAITDDLTTDLSRIGDSFVISRTTAFTYKGKPIDVKKIGCDLGVRYVLEGSVRRLGEAVQVNVQLIDAETGAHVWADRFDTDRRSLPRAQSEITSRLASTLKVGLLEAAGRQIALLPNPDARELMMQGWAIYYGPESQASLSQMQQIFERALELDPDSAEARVGIATAIIERVAVGYSKSRDEDMEKGDRLLADALARDRNLPRLHWALGLLRRLQLRLVESKIEFENTLALDHNFAGAMLQLGYTLNNLGQPEAALPHFEKAIKLTPRYQNIYLYYAGLGLCHLLLNRADEAIEFYEKARAANTDLYWIHWFLATALGLKGDIAAAKAALAEALKLKPELRSLADYRRLLPSYRSPPFAAVAARTLDVGLRRAGLPDE